MITIRFSSGLANRMFQYAYYIYLKEQAVEVYIDNNYKKSIGHKYCAHEFIEWNKIFPNAIYQEQKKYIIYKLGGGYDLISKLRRRYFPFTTKVTSIKNPFQYKEVNELKNKEYIIGIFQNAQMVSKIRDRLLDLYKFPNFTDKKNNNFLMYIQSCESVAIHVRKGKDYCSRKEYSKTCDINYYKKAIEIIKEKIISPIFFIFTDNIEWVKENFTFLDYCIIDWNPTIGWGNHFDMQLMSLCKHNIIANSTYSWWGAFLNKNPNKIIISPKIWFNSEHPILGSLKNLSICKDWYAI